MADNIELFLKTIFDGKGAKQAILSIGKLDDEAKKAAKSFDFLDVAMGGLVSNGLSNIVSFASQAGRALFDFAKNSQEAGSDLLETESLLANALGPALSDYERLVDDVADATGRSANIFKQSTASILAMTKAQGFAADEAARLSTEFGAAALDLNSYFNSTTAFEDLQSALAGSAETLFKYGINAKEGALQQEALRLGLIDSLGPLEQAQRTTALLSLVQRQASDAMGDAARTAQGSANLQRSTNEAFSDANAIIGKGLTEAWQPWQRLLNEIATNDLPGVAQGLSELAASTSTVSAGFIELRKQGETGGLLGNTLDLFSSQLTIAFGEELRLITRNLQDYHAVGLEVEAMEDRIATARERGGAGRGAGASGIGPILNEIAFEEALNVAESYDTRLTEITQKTYEIDNPFGNFDTSQTNFDAFFGSIDSATQTTISGIQNMGRAFSDLQSIIDGIDTGNLVDAAGDTESGALNIFTQQLGNSGADLNTQSFFLKETGTNATELNEKLKDLAEGAIAEAGLVAVGLNASNESINEFIQNAQEAVNTASDPIAAATLAIEEFQSSLDTVTDKKHNISVSFQVDGLEDLQQGFEQFQALAGEGVDVPDLEALAADAFGGTSSASRRQ